MSELEVVLFCPNSKLLTEPWEVIAKDKLRPKSARDFISNVVYMAKAFGEINRFHSKKLPDRHLGILHARMTRLRSVVRKMSAFRRQHGKEDLIPAKQLEYYFSGEDRKKIQL